jgi:hypothetical protein
MKIVSVILVLAALSQAQDNPERITVPFSDPSRPRMVRGNLMNGCFTVEGYDGKDVIIEARGSDRGHRVMRTPRGAEGLKRIDTNSFGLTVEEENNVVRIHSPMGRGGDILVRVPFATSLKLECMNGGEIKVDRVSGDLELQNLNGGVTVTNASGSVLAHSLNGKVTVSLNKVTPDKPMSFSTMNGDIDVTLPPDIKANFRMKSDNGEVFSDFDVKLLPNSNQPVVEDSRSKGGRYRVKVDKTAVGSVNGGGPELSFKTFNGNIFIRKRK